MSVVIEHFVLSRSIGPSPEVARSLSKSRDASRVLGAVAGALAPALSGRCSHRRLAGRNSGVEAAGVVLPRTANSRTVQDKRIAGSARFAENPRCRYKIGTAAGSGGLAELSAGCRLPVSRSDVGHGLDVLVQTKQVGWVVLPLDLHQPLVVTAVALPHPVWALVGHEVDVSPPW